MPGGKDTTIAYDEEPDDSGAQPMLPPASSSAPSSPASASPPVPAATARRSSAATTPARRRTDDGTRATATRMPVKRRKRGDSGLLLFGIVAVAGVLAVLVFYEGGCSFERHFPL